MENLINPDSDWGTGTLFDFMGNVLHWAVLNF